MWRRPHDAAARADHGLERCDTFVGVDEAGPGGSFLLEAVDEGNDLGLAGAGALASLNALVQQLESHVLVPLIQRGTVDLPPIPTAMARHVGR